MGGPGSGGRRTIVTPANRLPAVAVATAEGELNPLGSPDELAAVDIEKDIKRAMSELGEGITGAKVQVFRYIKGERKPFYATTYLPDAFSLERLADDCGGGNYDIIVYAPQIDENGRPTNMLKIVARSRQTIDGAPKSIKRPDPEPAPNTVAAPSDVALLASAMQKGFEQMAASLAKATERPSLIETLKELVAVKSLFSDGTARGPDPLEQFERFLKMQDTMKSAFERLPADASDNSLLLALGKDFLSMFKKATDAPPPAALPNPEVVSEDPLIQERPVPVPGPENPPVSVNSPEENPMNLIFKGYVNLLVTNAKANNDVEPIAQTIYDQAPDDLLAKLFATDAWLDELAKFNPQVKLYPQWFEKLRARIKEIHDADSAGA